MNKLNNFFAKWKGSNLFLSLFIGVSVVASTAAASGGFKFPGSTSSVKSDLVKVSASEAQASQGSSENNAQQEAAFPVTAQVLNIESAGMDLNRQNNRVVANIPSNQVSDNSSSTFDIQSASSDISDEVDTTSTSTLASFNSQTLMLHNKAGDCYVAYQGRVYDVSGQSVWNTCNYGIPGGADVTPGFPDAANYFASLPLVGTYYDPNYVTAAITVTTTNTTASTTATTTGSNTNSNQTTASATSTNATTTTGSTSHASTIHKQEGGDDNKESSRTSSGSQNSSGNTGSTRSSGGTTTSRSSRHDD